MKWTLVWSFLLTLCLAVPSAGADDCKKIIAGAGPTDFYMGCSYNGEDYLWCLDSPITGNLKGTWRFMSKPEDNFVEEIIPPDDDLGIGSWGVWVVWAHGVFETHKGDIVTQETDLLNVDTYFNYGARTSMANIIGGTGKFEGATGWIGIVMTETEGGVIRGMVCTP